MKKSSIPTTRGHIKILIRSDRCCNKRPLFKKPSFVQLSMSSEQRDDSLLL